MPFLGYFFNEPTKSSLIGEKSPNVGPMLSKLLLSVIGGFLCKARVLFILDWKRLPMTNALAYYKNPLFTDKKSFITLGPGHPGREIG